MSRSKVHVHSHTCVTYKMHHTSLDLSCQYVNQSSQQVNQSISKLVSQLDVQSSVYHSACKQTLCPPSQSYFRGLTAETLHILISQRDHDTRDAPLWPHPTPIQGNHGPKRNQQDTSCCSKRKTSVSRQTYYFALK